MNVSAIAPTCPVLCIDPGKKTGWAVVNPEPGAVPRILDFGVHGIEEHLEYLREEEFLVHGGQSWRVVVEQVGHYGSGMPAGKDVFDACRLIGRIEEILRDFDLELVRRQSIKTWLCGRATAKDANVRQALIDRWGGDARAIGARKCPGCKGKGWRGRGRPPCPDCDATGWETPPGPLHGIGTHVWSALAAGVYALEKVGT